MRSGDRENDPAVQAAMAGRIAWHRLGRADQHAVGDGGRLRTVAELDSKDNFRILRMVPVQYNRVHGLNWDNGALWVMFSSDYVIHRIDANTCKVLEMVTLNKDDPDPHGMCLHDGHLYYCDAGFPVGSNVNNDPDSDWIGRIDL